MSQPRWLSAVLAVASLAVFAPRAPATTVVGGIPFEDNAFADVLLDYVGIDPEDVIGTRPLAAALLGADVFSVVSPDEGESVTVGFLDNIVVNAAGTDLMVFELALPELITLEVSLDAGPDWYGPIDVMPFFTGQTTFFGDLNVAPVDLSSLGLPIGAAVNSVRLIGHDSGFARSIGPDLVIVAAFSSLDHLAQVPEPVTLALSGSAVLGLAGYAQRRPRPR